METAHAAKARDWHNGATGSRTSRIPRMAPLPRKVQRRIPSKVQVRGSLALPIIFIWFLGWRNEFLYFNVPCLWYLASKAHETNTRVMLDRVACIYNLNNRQRDRERPTNRQRETERHRQREQEPKVSFIGILS